MSSRLSDPTQVNLIEKWRLRHAYPDALGMWATATGEEAGAFAFNAIAQDPRVLQRAARRQAIKLAAQAEDFAQSVAEPMAARSDVWQAVTLLVQRSIDMWRRTLKAYDRRTEGAAVALTPAAVQVPSDDPWELARRNFPHVDDATGRLATRLLHEVGSGLFRRTRKPWDHVIVLAVLRHAARLLRGELTECEPGYTCASAIADIQTVQSYCEESGLSPLLVSYTGPGRPIVQALSLLRDARTLRDAVRTAEADGKEHAAFWQHAVDYHSYAVVALDHRILLDLPLDDAYRLAAAAMRQAEAAMRAPERVELPALPPGSASAPDVVRLHARACLPPEGSEAIQ